MKDDIKINYLFAKYKDMSLCWRVNKYKLIEDANNLGVNYVIVYKMVVNYQIQKYGCQLNHNSYTELRTREECQKISHKIGKNRKYRVDAYTQRYYNEKCKELC